MKCRHCGTEIADKALICFRCGAATTDPVYSAPAAARRGSRGSLTATVLALVLLGLPRSLARNRHSCGNSRSRLHFPAPGDALRPTFLTLSTGVSDCASSHIR